MCDQGPNPFVSVQKWLLIFRPDDHQFFEVLAIGMMSRDEEQNINNKNWQWSG